MINKMERDKKKEMERLKEKMNLDQQSLNKASLFESQELLKTASPEVKLYIKQLEELVEAKTN